MRNVLTRQQAGESQPSRLSLDGLDAKGVASQRIPVRTERHRPTVQRFMKVTLLQTIRNISGDRLTVEGVNLFLSILPSAALLSQEIVERKTRYSSPNYVLDDPENKQCRPEPVGNSLFVRHSHVMKMFRLE